jgi:alkanesulfonate monooxygenase SsuD/methylene tetrahydromethanopterin reductase-like flavin-dependent oxidoreductase (luciferase family)
MTDYSYGVLLPHFGTYADRDRLLDGARTIERYGFDSVWVRDHVIFHPHAHEDQNRTHVDPFVTLSAIAATTERITLAFGTLIPHRHPIHTALLLGSLEFIAGPGRVLAAWGIGGAPAEFDAIGMTGWDRREVLEEQVSIMRRLWEGGVVDHSGKYYEFADVAIQPVPQSGTIPLWYGGTSKAAVRRAVEYCDGWIPGRMPRRDYEALIERMGRLAGEAGVQVPHTGTIPLVSPAKTVELGAKYADMERLADEMQHFGYLTPPSGGYSSTEDFDGALMCGPPDVIVEEVRKHQATGAEHMVFDLRQRFSEWDECLAVLGEEILPELHRGDGRK